MSHLILHVLSEAQLLRGNADLGEEEVDSADEVTQDRVIDHTLQGEKQGKNPCEFLRKQSHDLLNFCRQLDMLHIELVVKLCLP